MSWTLVGKPIHLSSYITRYHKTRQNATGNSENVFYLVKAKAQIQQELLDEESKLGLENARRRREERLRNDPILGPFLQRIEEQARRKAG